MTSNAILSGATTGDAKCNGDDDGGYEKNGNKQKTVMKMTKANVMESVEGILAMTSFSSMPITFELEPPALNQIGPRPQKTHCNTVGASDGSDDLFC